MKVLVYFVRDTKNFLYFESQNFEAAFKTGRPAVKIWIPKAEVQGIDEDGNAIPGAFPKILEIGVLVAVEPNDEIPR